MTEATISFPVQGQAVIGTLALPPGPPAPVVLAVPRLHRQPPRDEDAHSSKTASSLTPPSALPPRVSRACASTFAAPATARAASPIPPMKPRSPMAWLPWHFLTPSRASMPGASPLSAGARAASSPPPSPVAATGPMPWRCGRRLPNLLPTLSRLLGADRVAAGLRLGDASMQITMPWGEIIHLNQGFFEGIHTTSPTHRNCHLSRAILRG